MTLVYIIVQGSPLEYIITYCIMSHLPHVIANYLTLYRCLSSCFTTFDNVMFSARVHLEQEHEQQEEEEETGPIRSSAAAAKARSEVATRI